MDWTTGLIFDLKFKAKLWESVNSGLDYWTGLLDWTTRLIFNLNFKAIL